MILKHPRMGGVSQQIEQASNQYDNLDLLKTIMMPLNLNQLGKILQKSKYQRIKNVLKLEDITMPNR